MTEISELIKIENMETTINEVTKFIKNEVFDIYQKKGVVIGLSGGIDSAVTLGLLKKTMELENSKLKKILVLSQPIHSSEWAYNRAKELCDKLNIELTVIDQTSIFDNLINIVEKNIGIKFHYF